MSDQEVKPVEFQEYQCTRKVHATPHTLGEFNAFLESREIPPVIGKPETEGFMLVYYKGTEREHISWSPADAFNESYTLIQ